MALNFTRQKDFICIQSPYDFKENYYDIEGRVIMPGNSDRLLKSFQSSYRQSDQLKTSVQDVQIQADFSAAAPAGMIV